MNKATERQLAFWRWLSSELLETTDKLWNQAAEARLTGGLAEYGATLTALERAVSIRVLALDQLKGLGANNDEAEVLE
jgi:Arc/MetJ family transcription regulator